METLKLIADIEDFEEEERKLIDLGWFKSGPCKPVNIGGNTYYSQEMKRKK